MSIMAKTPSGYKKIGSAYLGERPVDKVFNANGDVVYALQRELTGVPPLLFKGKEQSELLNYRIYGDTVDGESVGDRTGNLFDGAVEQGSFQGTNGDLVDSPKRVRSIGIQLSGGNYTISATGCDNVILLVYSTAADYILSESTTKFQDLPFSFSLNDERIIRFAFKKNDNSNILPSAISNIMLNEGSTALPYEPYGYKVPVTVKGKNLCNNIWEQGNIRADNGQKEESNIMICSDYFPVEYDKTYSISRTTSEGYNNVRGYDASKNYIGSGTTVCSVTNPFVNSDAKTGIFKITNSLVAFVRFNHYTNNLNMKYMIVEGDYTAETMPPYEPYHAPVTTPIYLPEPIKMVGDEAEYIDYAEQKMHRVRKNLLPNNATSQTINGVTFTVNGDGSVTCNGTSTSQYFSLFRIPCYLVAGNYTISGCPVGGDTRKYRADIRVSPNGNMVGGDADIGAGATIPIDESGWYDYTIHIQGGYTVDDLTFKPMIRKADIEDGTYEPYIENTDLDVTLPALPTIKGSNTMSIDTEVQPSRMDIKGRIKTLT